MINSMSTLKERLEESLNEATGVTKTSIWKACGISSGAVSQWFSGKTHTLEGENLLNTARVLNVDPNWLATGKGKKNKSSINIYDLSTRVKELSLHEVIRQLSVYLEMLDDDKKTLAGDALNRLANNPNLHKTVAAMLLSVIGESKKTAPHIESQQ